MKRADIARGLLGGCSARIDTEAGPQGTAFFVAPGFAVTAAHVIDGVAGVAVRLSEGSHNWRGHVAAVRPPRDGDLASTSPYPAPDIALIKIDDGPGHACALLAAHGPDIGARVMAYGYTQTFDQVAVTAETESFRLVGTLETPTPGCMLLKLGLGEVTQGMSGAPVLDLRTGEVIGMLRTSRKLGSNLGGWVVPADLIRQLWPEEVDSGNDLFHRQDARWRQASAQLREPSSPKKDTSPNSGLSIGRVEGGIGSIITGGNVDTVHIEYGRPGDRDPGRADG